MPVGTPIVSIAVPDPVPYGTAMASCSTSGSQNIVATSMPHGAQELTYRTFPTNIPGIGARLYNTAGSPDNAYPHSSAYTAPVGIYYGHSFTLQFVKVANVTGAGIVQAADVVSFQYDTDGNPVYLNFIATGSIQFIQGACQTPDVYVRLKGKLTDFPNVGSTGTAVPVNIQLNNCPGGMNGISYRIDPVTNVVNPAQSVVDLDASSSAAGVGVQLLTSGLNPFPLSKATPFTGYTGAGGSFTIPLMARYYRTGALSPGIANSAMTFTMTYY